MSDSPNTGGFSLPLPAAVSSPPADLGRHLLDEQDGDEGLATAGVEADDDVALLGVLQQGHLVLPRREHVRRDLVHDGAVRHGCRMGGGSRAVAARS